MRLLKKILRNEKGFILPTALVLLVLGGLLLVPSVYLLQTSLKAGNAVDMNTKALYAADAGVEHAVWRLIYDTSLTLPPPPPQDSPVQWPLPDTTINDASVIITLTNKGSNLYKIESVATWPDGHKTTIVDCYVKYSPSGTSVFNNAVVGLNGNITMSNGSHINSTPQGDNGDVYVNGNLIMSNNAGVDGHASATGSISLANGAHIDHGQSQGPGTPAIDAAALATAMNTLIANWEAAATNTGCSGITCGGTYHANDWAAPGNTSYPDKQNVQRDMSLLSGTWWTFQQTVCTGRNMNLSRSAPVTFNGPVKIGGDLNISAGTVTFNGAVCVGGNLNISGGTVIFNGKVQVGSTFTGSGNATTIQFKDTLYVVGNLALSNSTTVTLGGYTYVHGALTLSNSAILQGGQNIIADGDITLSNNSSVNPGMDPKYIPFLISTGGNVTVANNGGVTRAIIYAPGDSPNDGNISLQNGALLTGCAVGKSVTLSNNSTITYPEEFETRTDLPITIGVGTGGWSIQVYNVL